MASQICTSVPEVDKPKRRLRQDAGEVAAWLILAAGLAIAAAAAASILQATVTSLAEEVGGSSSASAIAASAAQGDPGSSEIVDEWGPLPTLASQGLTLRSRKAVVGGEEVLVLEVTDEAGNVVDLPPIELNSDSDSDSDGNAGTVENGGGAGDTSAAARPRDELDDYTIEDYEADQIAQGITPSTQSLALAAVELQMIQDAFADHDPEVRDRVLDDIRFRPGGTAPVAHIVGEGAAALPQDHYQDNLLGLIADTLFGFLRSPKRKPPTQIETPYRPGMGDPPETSVPVDNDSDDDGVPNLIDPDYNPTLDDLDGDGIPNYIDPDTAPADPFDLDIPVAPVVPEPVRPVPVSTPGGGGSDYDDPPATGPGSTSNPGNPDNPAGEPDECHGSCA